MEFFICAVLGYFIGCFSPAAVISKIKKKNLKEIGTKNLGATNVLLNFGKAYGALVMLIDMAKAVVAFKLCEFIFSDYAYAGLIAGLFSMLGHDFPFYLKFKGGKGLSCYGGLVLAYNWKMFFILLAVTIVLILIVNYTFVMPYAGGIAFPVMATIASKNVIVCIITAVAGIILMIKHFENLKKAFAGEDIKVRQFIKNKFKA